MSDDIVNFPQGRIRRRSWSAEEVADMVVERLALPPEISEEDARRVAFELLDKLPKRIAIEATVVATMAALSVIADHKAELRRRLGPKSV